MLRAFWESLGQGTMVGSGPKCSSKARLDGKTAIVTGSNSGIGKYTAMDFYERGCHVVMACRNMDKAAEVKKMIEETLQDKEATGTLVLMKLDLSSFKSVRQFAEDVLKSEDRIDILVNNAGVFMHPKELSGDGYEMHWATNHLGPFLLTLLLLPRLQSSATARLINVSSCVHTMGKINFEDLNYDVEKYSPFLAYCRSKLAELIVSKILAGRLKDTGVHVYCVHPGIVNTDGGRYLNQVLFRGAERLVKMFGGGVKSPKNGAQTTIHCAVDEGVGQESGLYYYDCRVGKPSDQIEDEVIGKRLWDTTLQAIGMDDAFANRQRGLTNSDNRGA